MKPAPFVLLILCMFCSGIIVSAQTRTKQEKGFFNITNIGEVQLMRSIDSSEINGGLAFVRSGAEFNTINGVFLNTGFSIGLGLGAQLTSYKYTLDANSSNERYGSPNMLLFPIFADIRYYPSDLINGAMFIIDAGYAPLLKIANDEHRSYLNGGPLVKLGAGYKLHLSDGVSFLPSVNFKAQRFGDNTTIGFVAGVGLLF